MSFHRACCCRPTCPHATLTLSLSGIHACTTCRTPVDPPFGQSIKVTHLDSSGSFSARYAGIDYGFDAGGEHKYSSTADLIFWEFDVYNNLDCTEPSASSLASPGQVQIWQDIATCEIVRCHALVSTRLGVPGINGILFASSQRHTIGTALDNELDCLTDPPFWIWGSGWPDTLIVANGGSGIVTL